MTFKKLRRGQPAVPFPLACAVCSLLDGVLVPCSLLCPGIPFLCSIFGSVAPVIVLARRLTLSRRGAASCMSACRLSIPLAHPTDEPPMPLHQRNRPAMPPSPQPHTHTTAPTTTTTRTTATTTPATTRRTPSALTCLAAPPPCLRILLLCREHLPPSKEDSHPLPNKIPSPLRQKTPPPSEEDPL